MTADVPTAVIDAGTIAVAITAVITLLTLLSRSRPGKWFVQMLRDDAVERRTDDMRRVLDVVMPSYLAPILYELRANGGASFRDQIVERLEVLEDRQDDIEARLDELRRIVTDSFDQRENHAESD